MKNNKLYPLLVISLFVFNSFGQNSEVEIFDFPDVKASFVGGSSALSNWINENVYYPQTSIENEEGGRVFASFVVEIDGSITNIKIERGVSETLDREVVLLISKMPNWNPAKVKDKKVRSRCRLPIVFNYQ